MELFDHERLRVYQAARRFNRMVAQLAKRIGVDPNKLVDQLIRAATSITRNIIIEPKKVLSEVIAMLVVMIKRLDDPDSSKGTAA